MKVAVAGAIASKPRNGGEAWVRLSYVLGFRQLGLDVSFVEEVDEASDDAVAWFREIVPDGALVDRDGRALVGTPPDDGDLLVNVSGNLRNADLLRRWRRRAYVDLDPGFTQLWHADGLLDLGGHDVYFTVGENVGRGDCAIPTDGIEWRPTRPPVVLDDWPQANGGFDRFTTVATWRTARVGGYGVKLDEFRKFASLPRRVEHPFELALAIHPAEEPDLALLDENGWRVVDPPEDFRAYVQRSGAEFSVAQGVYVETRSGWFSDRTARYLASGKPALVQDTGSPVPSGEGLLTFTTLEEAAAGADAIARDHERHARAARALAEEHLDSDRVLTRLLEDAL